MCFWWKVCSNVLLDFGLLLDLLRVNGGWVLKFELVWWRLGLNCVCWLMNWSVRDIEEFLELANPVISFLLTGCVVDQIVGYTAECIAETC